MFLRRRRVDPLEAAFAALRREFVGRIGWTADLPESPPRFAEPRRSLPVELKALLRASGIDGLYPHQATAYDALCDGRDVAIATPTASGKTLAVALPLFERLLREPDARALLVAPTNALVNDQARALTALAERLPRPPHIAVLTGASAADARRALRSAPPHLLITNPEMLHLSLCGQHRLWQRFWINLRFVVLDEMHLYRGVFGAQMAMLLRRALRIAALYRARPQIAGCSATVGNPEELAERLTGRDVAVLRGDGAARGARSLLVLRPPLAAGSAASQATAVHLFCRLVERGAGTILFALTRRGAETMSAQARELLDPALQPLVAPYRGGLAPRERERIEQELKTGRLRGVVATNALEVGIDIGGLDAAVIAGFPGSRASFWQQAGRAGRGRRPALVAFVPYARALDAYYATHDRALLAGAMESVAIDLANDEIAARQLGCAALEAPLNATELPALGFASDTALRLAEGCGLLVREDRGWRAGAVTGLAGVNLRGSAEETWTIVAPQGEIGTIDEGQRGIEAHHGAVYLHGGRRYRVRASDPLARTLSVSQEPDDLVTEPLVLTVAAPLQPLQRSAAAPIGMNGTGALRAGAGRLRIIRTTVGYREGRRHGGRRHTVTLDVPERREFETAGLWYIFADELRRALDGQGSRRFASALHALEHLLPAAAALHVLCDPRDVVASFEERHEGLGGAALFLYDAIAGGCGIAERLAGEAVTLLTRCREIVARCRCRDGCPACVLSAACWRAADQPEKAAALQLLEALGI